jgi:hypothetical protein
MEHVFGLGDVCGEQLAEEVVGAVGAEGEAVDEVCRVDLRDGGCGWSGAEFDFEIEECEADLAEVV